MEGYVEGGPLGSSEEWKEKGAAVGIRRERNADGKMVSRLVKKGVKDFNFGRTLGEGSYSTVSSTPTERKEESGGWDMRGPGESGPSEGVGLMWGDWDRCSPQRTGRP